MASGGSGGLARATPEPGDASVEVALDEASADAVDGIRADGHGTEPHSHGTADEGDADGRAVRLRRLSRPVVVALVLVGALVLAGAATTWLDQRQDGARRAAVADVSGVVGALEHPLTERWAVAGRLVATTEGLAVVADHEKSTLAAVDLGTGDVRWIRPVDREMGAFGSCDPASPWGERADEDLLLCSTAFDVPVTDRRISRLELVRLDDGTTAAVHRQTGGIALVEEVESDHVLVTVDREGVVHAARWDPRAGTLLWTWDAGEAVDPDLDGEGPPIGLRDGALIVAESDALDVRTGTPVPVPPPFDDVEERDDTIVRELPSGHRAVVRWSDGGTGAAGIQASDGTYLYDLPGGLEVPWFVDDGSRADLVLVADPAGFLAGLDVGTGETLWTVHVPFGHTLLLLDGLLVRAEERFPTGLDLVIRDSADGSERWRVRTTDRMAWTDGVVVLATELGETAGSPVADSSRDRGSAPSTTGVVDLVARRLGDGTEVWRSAFRPSEGMEVAPDGTWLVQEPTSVSAWR